MLRHGYTTGACAAAAARAAALALATQTGVREVEIMLPAGFPVTFQVASCQWQNRGATASVIKDAGDDPDITQGAEIIVRVEIHNGPDTIIEAGEGVGRVTRPGLGLAVGGPAITAVPRRMILEAVSGIPEMPRTPLQITISVPGGEKLAQRTLNPRLGIVGGISILGTTGVVVPYSTEAYQATIKLALDIAVATDCQEVALCTGGQSEKFARGLLRLPLEVFIQMADFAGFALQECVRHGMRRVYLCGFIGKLSKIAAGNFSTHVSKGELGPDFLPALAACAGVGSRELAALRTANTARHFQEMVPEKDRNQVFNRLCQSAREKSEAYVEGKIQVDCLLFDFEGRLLARTDSHE